MFPHRFWLKVGAHLWRDQGCVAALRRVVMTASSADVQWRRVRGPAVVPLRGFAKTDLQQLLICTWLLCVREKWGSEI